MMGEHTDLYQMAIGLAAMLIAALFMYLGEGEIGGIMVTVGLGLMGFGGYKRVQKRKADKAEQRQGL